MLAASASRPADVYNVPDDEVDYHVFCDVYDWDHLRFVGTVRGSRNLHHWGVQNGCKWWHGYNAESRCILQFTANTQRRVFVTWATPSSLR